MDAGRNFLKVVSDAVAKSVDCVSGPSSGGWASSARTFARPYPAYFLTARSPLTQGHEFVFVGNHTWRLADHGARHMLLKEGIGWCNMPEPMVRKQGT
ncbi:LysR family transcriptional regulator [Rhizobium grahamii CCGE 502]|uniref:LysR family transcriptional regulator n=1 Tax=Rhizobium grahamii CCGE 502 TaxID=990285 RepID=S3IBX5_9HYPH|nr:LysR family transcriptional regulator [Rhizobium grahamii CCGE 502]